MKTFTDDTKKMAVRVLWGKGWFLEEIAFVVGKSKKWVISSLVEAGLFMSADAK